MSLDEHPVSNQSFYEGGFSFREFLEETDDLVTQVDPAGNILYISSSSIKIYGLTPEECLGQPAFKFIHPEDLENTKNAFDGWLRGSDSNFSHINRVMHRDGGCHYMLWSITAIKNEEGSIRWFNSIARDITPQKTAELELRRIYNDLESIVDKRTKDLKLAAEVFKYSLEGITITDHNNLILDINKAFTTITGYSKEEAVGENPRILKSDRHDEAFYKLIWVSIEEKGTWEGEIWNRRKNGEVYPQWLAISSVTDQKGELTNYVAVFHDISEAKANQEQLKYQAYHDALTGLPNRALLIDRLRKAIAAAARDKSILALLFIDLDNFKDVNDSLGHPVGDKVLQEAATRITDLVRESDTVSRLGGDEFVIMLSNVQNAQNAVILANRIIESFASAFVIHPHRFVITPSIGITFYPADGVTPEVLIRNADLAMYRAKNTGRNKYHLFTPGLSESLQRRISMEHKLRDAVRTHSLTVYYQPKIRISDGKIIGMEALARWIQPDGSMIPPLDFIPLAEETGLIIPLGEQVLEMACLDTAELNQRFDIDLKVSVNLSLKQFKQKKLCRSLRNIISMAELSPENLEMEITESTVMNDIDQTKRTLGVLADEGITFSVDDFGTGYSSLTHIKHLPLHTLKIDKSFVDGLPKDESDAKIATVILSLAKCFDLTAVAEGVETVEQYKFLKNIGCDVAQGYLYSPPLPVEKFAALLSAGSKPFARP